MRWNYPVDVYDKVFERFKAIAPQQNGLYGPVKNKEAYGTFSAEAEEVVEETEDAVDIADDEDEFYKERIAARENPAEEDKVKLEQDPTDGEDGAGTGGLGALGEQAGKGDVGTGGEQKKDGLDFKGEQTPKDSRAENISTLQKRLVALRWNIINEHQATFCLNDTVTDMLYHMMLAANSGDVEAYEGYGENLRGYVEHVAVEQAMEESLKPGS